MLKLIRYQLPCHFNDLLTRRQRPSVQEPLNVHGGISYGLDSGFHVDLAAFILRHVLERHNELGWRIDPVGFARCLSGLSPLHMS